MKLAGLGPGTVKQFRKGLEQLDEEGVVQVLRDPDLGDQAPVLAAVGPMQFEVAVHRLEVDMVGGRDSDSGLAGVPGVKEVRREGDHLLISYEGSADPLIKALAAHDVSAIRSRDDDLEEVFLDLYRDRGEGS